MYGRSGAGYGQVNRREIVDIPGRIQLQAWTREGTVAGMGDSCRHGYERGARHPPGDAGESKQGRVYLCL